MGDRAAIQEQIKIQGEVVRKLKAEKADKDTVGNFTKLTIRAWDSRSYRPQVERTEVSLTNCSLVVGPFTLVKWTSFVAYIGINEIDSKKCSL